MATEKQTEKHKALSEYLRFLTTLSTGSIVLLTSFLEKLQAQPQMGFLIGLAFVGFSLCVVMCVIAYSSVVLKFGEHFSDSQANIPASAIAITWLSFIVAIASLTIFAVFNL